ncbi:MAG: D-alanyl-D-alanine endopeptidase [Betaproteobacteria bacterium]|nr:D-alanyl-D-alanine endopeptidase [Betaproteobacteria bacterium]
MNRLLHSVLAALLCAQLPAIAGADAPDPAKLKLHSANVIVMGAGDDKPMYSKNAEAVTPIASITKLMTAMVVLDAKQSPSELLTVDIPDLDMLKGSHSRLRLGVELPRSEMLRLALMSSENRAASALCRYYPGGTDACVLAMNAKAIKLGMSHSHFSDPTGLSSDNMSTARDLVKMVRAASEYPLIREFSTTPGALVDVPPTGRSVEFHNTNSLVRAGSWDIQLQKTGFIREAGRCLVMMANVASKPVVIVLLDSFGKLTRIGDANRIRHWMETGEALQDPKPVRKKKVLVKHRYR